MSTVAKRTVFLVLAVLLAGWTLFIFSNSMKSKDESSKESSKIVQIVKPVVDPKDKIPISKFHKMLRKTAHAFEFGVQGVLACGASLAKYNRRRKWLFLAFPPMFCALCAAADECIQLCFDRGAAFTDVLIDMGGASAGIIIFASIFALCRKINVK